MVREAAFKRSKSALFIQLTAFLSIVIALCVLSGWFLNIELVKSLGPGLSTMKFNTAFSFLLVGLALWGISRMGQPAKFLSWTFVTSAVVLLGGILTAFQYLLGVDLGMDQFLIPDAQTADADYPGRMSIATALNFCLVGGALMLIHVDRLRAQKGAQVIALVVLLISLVALVGYLLKPASLYQFAWFQSVALHTALLFFLISIGVLLLRPGVGITQPLASRLLGGRFARGMLPIMVILPIATGWLLVACIDEGALDAVMALNIFVVSNTLIIVATLWFHARAQNRIHADLLKQNERLRQSENDNALLAAIVTHTKDAIICLDERDRVNVWNTGAEHVFGIEASKAMNQPLLSIFPANLLDVEWLQQAREGKVIFGHELSLSQSDGRRIDVSISISPVRSRDGDLIGVSLIAHEVTHLRQIENERDSALKDLIDFKTALDEHAIVAITNASGRITYVNDKFCAISKYSREELIGQDHRLINSGYHSKEFFQNLWRTISSGKVWRGEIRNRTKQGEYYWVDTTIVPFLDEDGRPRQYVAIRADITERVRSTEALAQQADELARSNSDLEQFAYVASHDLQEPLRGIDGCIQLLERRYKNVLDERGQDYIEHTVGNVERMQRLIRDLLKYSRVGTRKREFQPVKLADVLADAQLNLATAINEKGARISHDELPKVFGDRTHLGLVFQNLISNALKFCQEKPIVHISAIARDDLCEITIKDNGIGIEPEYFERIFVIFQRLHGREKYPGTGIGLALCKRIIQHHGGQIWVESEAEEGSEFHFTLRKVDQTVTKPSRQKYHFSK